MNDEADLERQTNDVMASKSQPVVVEGAQNGSSEPRTATTTTSPELQQLAQVVVEGALGEAIEAHLTGELTAKETIREALEAAGELLK